MIPSALIRSILGCFVPHSLVMLRQRRWKRRVASWRQAVEAPTHSPWPYSYEDSVHWLTSQSLEETHVREGSIPERSLAFVCRRLRELLATSRPVTALHIGNFVGLSLCYVVNELRTLNPDSMVLAIDPNIAHRGVKDPQNYVLGLLSRYGLQNNCVLVCGYSLAKNLGDDGGIQPSDEPAVRKRYPGECACEGTLLSLEHLMAGNFDCAFVDGNHDDRYLTAEVEVIRRLLRPGGVLVLDDVSEGWTEIRSVFEAIKPARQTSTFQDGRVGIVVLDS